MAMSKLARARYQRQRRALQGAVTRDYDPATDRYTLQPAQLDNLLIGQARVRSAAEARRKTIAAHVARGLSVADIALITGISRAAVYRLMPSGAKRAYSLKHRKHVDPLLL